METNMDNCPICLSELDAIHTLKISCSHSYHHSCIFEWISHGNAGNYKLCPSCRSPLKADCQYVIWTFKLKSGDEYSNEKILCAYGGALYGLDYNPLRIINFFLKMTNRIVLRYDFFLIFNPTDRPWKKCMKDCVKFVGYELFDECHDWYTISCFIVVLMFTCRRNCKYLIYMQNYLARFLKNELNIQSWIHFTLEREREYFRDYELKVIQLVSDFLTKGVWFF